MPDKKTQRASNEDITRDKTKRAYDKVGPGYDSWYWSRGSKALRQSLTERALGILAEELKKEDGKLRTADKKPKILDLCCGTGHLVVGLSKLGSYTGLDFAPSMIEHCGKSYPGKEFALGDAEKMPFPDNSFDAVVCFWSFHHFVRPERVMDEVLRVLKPGGVAVIATFKDVKLNLAAKLGDAVSSAYWGFVTKRHSEKGMKRMMSGFSDVKTEVFPKGFSLLNAMGIRFIIAKGRK